MYAARRFAQVEYVTISKSNILVAGDEVTSTSDEVTTVSLSKVIREEKA